MKALSKALDVDPELVYRKIKQAEARENLLDFTLYTKPDYKVNWHHRLICDTLDGFLADPNRQRLMIFVGPRRGKSEIVSRRLPAYAFGKNPDLEIMASSYAAELAQAMSRDTQRIIDDPKYMEVFPEVRLSGKNVVTSSQHNYVRTADKFEIVGHKGKYNCAGVNGPLTGKGADLFIVDDPIKGPEDAQSALQKQKAYEWFQSVASTRLSPDGKIIIVLTRWADDDLAGRLLADAENDPESYQWEVVSIPEMYNPDHKYLHPNDPREVDGEVLWPARFSQEKMEKLKKSTPRKWWDSLFQQEPTSGGGTIINGAWFKYYKELPNIEYTVISWDCAFKDADDSDYVAGTVWGISGVNKYLLWVIRKRLSFVETLKQMIFLNNRFPNARYTIVEDKANGPAIISTLKNKIKGLVPYSPTESKESRTHSISPQVEAGNVWLPDMYYEPNRTACPWMLDDDLLDKFIKEVQGFPYAKHDDMLDSMVQMLIKVGGGATWFDEMVKGNSIPELPQTVEEIANTKHNQMVAEKMGWDIDGASEYDTGFSFDLNF